eukprot:m.65030 g.65030  ORF g.65030 m.65030 type:complete len:785 (+) comp16464_c1_seq1:376-2730(+)
MQRMSTQRLVGNRHSHPRGRAYWNTKVYIKIGEAKSLPAKDLNGLCDPYVLIRVDDETVARTSTIWKQRDPIFSEEFILDMAPDFQELSLDVYDFDKLTADDAIGRVTISREKLQHNPDLATDQWHPLTKITRETTCTGEVQVELLLSETETGLDQLVLTVIQARDLTQEIRCDPYAIVELDLARKETERAKNTRFPVWQQHFTFERVKLGPEARVSVRTAAGFGTAFLGEAVIPLTNLTRDIPKREWFRLRPREKDLEGLKEGNGSLRMSVKYTHELILPESQYEALCQYFVANAQSEDLIDRGILGMLETLIVERESNMDRELLARTLTRMMINQNISTTFLRNLNQWEIMKAKEPSTLLRGNSLASKCTDQFMKIVGLRYLHDTVKPVVDLVFKEDKNCEIDPAKLGKQKSDDILKKHLEHLKTYLDTLFDTIFESDKRCPLPMRLVFKQLRLSVAQNPALQADGSQTSYTVVSAFLFLRFFAPAVLSPKLFGMREELADLRTSRTLTLLAKSLQTVGNIGSTIGSGKESFMEPLYPTLLSSIDRVKDFIDRLCDVKDVPDSDIDLEEVKNPQVADDLLISGVYPLRYDSGGVFSSKPLKKQEIQLTNKKLVTWKVGQLSSRLELPIERILSVERLELSVFDKKHVVRVSFRGLDPLFINFGSSLDLDAWIQLLRKVIKVRGASITPGVHVGVFRKDKWSCCRQPDVLAPHCSKAHSTTATDQFSDNPGPEVWAHRMFSYLQGCRGKIEASAKERPALAELIPLLDELNLAYLLQVDQPLS